MQSQAATDIPPASRRKRFASGRSLFEVDDTEIVIQSQGQVLLFEADMDDTGEILDEAIVHLRRLTGFVDDDIDLQSLMVVEIRRIAEIRLIVVRDI